MKVGKSSVSGASIAVLVIQLAIVSSIAGKYLYQRWTCPKVWVRTEAVDPDAPMRGRYLSARLLLNGCRSTLPSAAMAQMPRNADGLPMGKRYRVHASGRVQFLAKLRVEDNQLLAIRIPESEGDSSEQLGGQFVVAWPEASCDELRLDSPVNFYLPEHAQIPATAGRSHWDAQGLGWVVDPNAPELWMEVTVPPKGPPRPTQLALKENGVWKPLGLE